MQQTRVCGCTAACPAHPLLSSSPKAATSNSSKLPAGPRPRIPVASKLRRPVVGAPSPCGKVPP
eukprot:1375966-Alexandrium_andersonii.AAC.1